MTEPGPNDQPQPPQQPVDPTHAFQAPHTGPETQPGFIPADIPIEAVPDPFAGISPAAGPAPEADTPQSQPMAAEAEPASENADAAADAFAAPIPLDVRASDAPPPPPPPPPYLGPVPSYGYGGYAQQPKEPYPVRLQVEYREPLSRLTTFFRGFLVLPLLLFSYFVSGAVYTLIVAARLAIFCRRKYPDWILSFAAGHLAWQARFVSYWLLLTDAYPSFSDEGGPTALEVDAPVQGQLSRWRGLLWRTLLLVPHLIVLSFLWLAVFVVTFMAWFAILITGRYPRGLFGFVVGVQRWTVRTIAYSLMLTDRFPPYALSAEAGPAGSRTVVWTGVAAAVGALAYGGIIIGVIVAASNRDLPERQVDYAKLSQGSGSISLTFNDDGGPVTVLLVRAYDPGTDQLRALNVAKSDRVVVFEWTIRNNSSSDKYIGRGIASLTADQGGKNHDYSPEFVIIEDRSAPASIRDHGIATVRAVFILPVDARPTALDFNGGNTGTGAIGEVRYRFAQ